MSIYDVLHETLSAKRDLREAQVRIEQLEAALIDPLADAAARARSLPFSQRVRFFKALQPRTERGELIAWPDAIMFIKTADVDRAVGAARDHANRAAKGSEP